MKRIMEKNSREKIALIVFLVLAIAAGCVLFGYIFAGHSWNIAASNLDDTFGNMDGYTVIAYEGTLDEGKDDASDGSSEKTSGAERALTSPQTADRAKEASKTATGAEKTQGGDLSGQSGVSSAGNATDAGAQPAVTTPNAEQQDAPSAPLAGHKKEKADVSLSDVEATYKDKGASILLLDTANPSAYDEGMIVKRGGKRYGVFSLEAETSRILVDEKVKYFTEQGVDYVIAIVPDARLLKGAEGIDIVVSTDDVDASKMGEAKNGSFVVAAPAKGSVGAILISPSNVVSAKTISGQ